MPNIALPPRPERERTSRRCGGRAATAATSGPGKPVALTCTPSNQNAALAVPLATPAPHRT
jgi:hypothetical protein